MKEIIPGIYQLVLPLPDTKVEFINVYLVKGNNGYLMIDTGWNISKALSSLKIQLAEIGIGIKDITQIVITHIHPDHYGLAGRLRRLSGAHIALHYLEKALIDSRYNNMDNLLVHVGRWLQANGVPAIGLSDLQMASAVMAKYVSAAKPDVALYDGETLSTGLFNLEVLWTPGHSPGHICLYEPDKKLLFSGDHILPTITPNVGLHPESSFNPLGDYINALKRVKHLDIRLILPGHESPFTGIQARIDEILRHHEIRDASIRNTISAEQKTAFQIASEITWASDTRGTDWQTLSPLDKRLAILETIAHLEAMRANGLVNKHSSNGTVYYQSVR